jgi:hypothetical protein
VDQKRRILAQLARRRLVTGRDRFVLRSHRTQVEWSRA